MPVETARPKFGLDFLAEVVVAASFTSWFGMMEHGQATPERTPPLGNSPAAELRTRWANLMTVEHLSNESGRGADGIGTVQAKPSTAEAEKTRMPNDSPPSFWSEGRPSSHG
jgi:hypothetical protein